MKILLEQSGYELSNLGDLAMLQFAVHQIHRRWPQAEINVLTTLNRNIDHLVDRAKPIMLSGRDAVLSQQRLFGAVHPQLSTIDRWLWRRLPGATERLMTLKTRVGSKHHGTATRFRKAVMEADCVVASGGGFITDSFPDMVRGVCSTLAMAQRYGKPTAMFGQGLGPIEDPNLIRHAQSAMQNLATLSLREPVFSPKVAAKLNVPADKTAITGDNATFFAYRKRKDEFGDAIGINVRVASYSGVGTGEYTNLREQINATATRLGATLHPVLICKYHRDDVKSSELCPPEFLQRLPMDTPEDIIDVISRCRIVITGSYHAAVFALSQGIPVIGLALNPYYKAKFEGLRGLYPSGIRIMSTTDLEEPGALANKAAELYEQASTLRSDLLEISGGIIEKSNKAYNRFFDIVERSQ